MPEKVLVKLRSGYGKKVTVSTPSTTVTLTDEPIEVDIDVYERKLKRFAEIVTTKEKKEIPKREKKTETFVFKDEEL